MRIYPKMKNKLVLMMAVMVVAGYLQIGLGQNLSDADSDGLSDSDEINIHKTDPNDPDSDGDGLTDGDEINIHNTNPNNPDTDGDGLEDFIEINIFETRPLSRDSNGNGITDGHEDADSDGLSNQDEILLRTNPLAHDTDGDGLPDGVEVAEGFNPLIGSEASDGELTIRIAIEPESVELEFFTLKSQDYQLQWSIDLSKWYNDASPFKGVGGFSSILRYARTDGAYWRLKVVE
jgi:hypothetical protein